MTLAQGVRCQVLNDLGLKASEEEVVQMFNAADVDGGGT